MPALLEIEKLRVSYDGKTILHDACVSVEKGKIVGIAGESGSGKTTLVHAVLGALHDGGIVDDGSIQIDGQELLGLKPKALRGFLGRETALVSQSPQATFSPVRTVGSQYYEIMRLRDDISRDEAHVRAVELLKRLGFEQPEEVLASYVFELSGGMAQRAAIGLALATRPNLLFADEPTSALDVTVQSQVVEELMRVNKEFGTSMVVISHNIAVLAHMSDYLYVMKDGRVVEEGPTEQVVKNPSAEYTRVLMDAVPQFGGKR